MGEVDARRFHRRKAVGDFALVANRRGDDLRFGDAGRQLCFDVDRLLVVFEIDLIAAVEFAFTQDLVLAEEFDGFLADENGHGIDGGLEVGEAAFFGFRVPRFGVTVAVEDDFFVLLDDVGENAWSDLLKSLPAFTSASILVAM